FQESIADNLADFLRKLHVDTLQRRIVAGTGACSFVAADGPLRERIARAGKQSFNVLPHRIFVNGGLSPVQEIALLGSPFRLGRSGPPKYLRKVADAHNGSRNCKKFGSGYTVCGSRGVLHGTGTPIGPR